MMPFIRLAAFAAVPLAVSTAALAQTQPQPTVEVRIDGESFPVPLASLDGKTYAIGAGGEGAVIESGGALVILTGTLDPDPSISYGLTVTDFGTPSTFAFIFSTPIVPTATPADVVASLVGGLTDASGADGVSLAPFGNPLTQIASLGFPSTSMGVDIGTPFVGPSTGVPNSTSVYGPFDTGLLPAPTPGPWTHLSVTTGFTLSGNNDIAALTGSAAILPIPSPTLALPGLLFLATSLPRRRRPTPKTNQPAPQRGS